jgi:hypothetical protein
MDKRVTGVIGGRQLCGEQLNVNVAMPCRTVPLAGHSCMKYESFMFSSGGDSMMANLADTGEQATGGVVGAVKAPLGSFFGGGSEALISKFGQLGMSADQIQTFIPKVLEFPKGKLPENLANRVKDWKRARVNHIVGFRENSCTPIKHFLRLFTSVYGPRRAPCCQACLRVRAAAAR